MYNTFVMKKKIFLGAGIAVATATPVALIATAFSTPKNDYVDKYSLLPTYTAQADQLIALGIKPDYYPYQLDQHSVFSYISNPTAFMFGQSDEFKRKFGMKIKSLIPSAQGTS